MSTWNIRLTTQNHILFYGGRPGGFPRAGQGPRGRIQNTHRVRQIGVRDEAKMMGGLGPCGRACCCTSFLGDFSPVSIKMAKEQNLSLSPTKISGLCGRLMCCLNYEQEHYAQMRQRMPKVGSAVTTPDGEGVVLENNMITEIVRVKLALPDGSVDVKNFRLDDVKFKISAAPPTPKEPEIEEELDEDIEALLED